MSADRPLFDPSRIRVPESEKTPPATSGALTPWQVNELIRGAIARHVPATLSVIGELGDVSRSVMGHLYFTLKDDRSELRCVMWKSAAQSLKFEPKVGLQVIVHGGLEMYAPRGALQLIVRRIEPRGVGALELAFRQLREKLEREGLFAAARKRPIPRFPTRIAVVTSPRGAALRDITRTLARRFPYAEIVLFPTRVQGEGAAAEIAAAIALMNRSAAALDGIDVAIVGRGGGSLEDLWAFNEEAVARAIAASDVPIVSAVGHEVDFSIADFVADLRAATPTAAAELVSPDRAELRAALNQDLARLRRGMATLLQFGRRRFEALLSREPLARPTARIRYEEQRVDERFHALRWALAAKLRAARGELTRVESRLLRGGARVDLIARRRHIDRLIERAHSAVARRVSSIRTRFAVLREELARRSPERRLASFSERVRQLSVRLRHAGQERLRRFRDALESRAALLEGLNPRGVLRRGYSVTRHARTRELLRSIQQISENTPIVTELADGEFRSTAHDPRQGRLFD